MNRWNAYTQLVLTRFREFFREPEVVFWVYGFPLILAVGLGLAFSGGKPDPPAVDIVGPDTSAEKLAALLRAVDMKVEIHPKAECEYRLRIGKTVLFVSVHGSALE